MNYNKECKHRPEFGILNPGFIRNRDYNKVNRCVKCGKIISFRLGSIWHNILFFLVYIVADVIFNIILYSDFFETGDSIIAISDKVWSINLEYFYVYGSFIISSILPSLTISGILIYFLFLMIGFEERSNNTSTP